MNRPVAMVCILGGGPWPLGTFWRAAGRLGEWGREVVPVPLGGQAMTIMDHAGCRVDEIWVVSDDPRWQEDLLVKAIHTVAPRWGASVHVLTSSTMKPTPSSRRAMA